MGIHTGAVDAERKLDMFSAMAQPMIGWATACTTSSAEGLALLRENLMRRRRASGWGTWLGVQHLCVFAEVYAAARDLPAAFATLDDAFALLGEQEVLRPDLLRCRGDLLAQRGDDFESAEAAYREARERARAMGALLFELRAATGLARLLQHRSRVGEAHALLAPVYARFTDGFEMRDLVEAKAALDALAAVGAP